MPFAIIVAVLGMPASAATMALPASVWRVSDFASMPRTCAVLQAAYTAAIGHHAPAYPLDVRSSAHSLGSMTDIAPDARKRLAMSADEFTELATRQEIYRSDVFRPICAWKGRAAPPRDDEGHAMFVTFTSPVFSTTGRLALVEVSFREQGAFSYGLLCTVRSLHVTWKARCGRSWSN
ncbi:hypothetical protein [Sphingomonas sp. 8AM]|uniref:hypothetical protein n=1 Tax=Sphingomonas sp. 8AM TaxID=2653170 RepID=UPI00135732C0|nr:hypothetical protein [Sphingomonas sp. 8AM]